MKSLDDTYCERQEIEFIGPTIGLEKKGLTYSRCPKCNRRLKSFVIDCEDMFHLDHKLTKKQLTGRHRCLHRMIPRHKTKGA